MLFYFFIFIVIDSFAASLPYLPSDIVKRIGGDNNIKHAFPLMICYVPKETLYLPATDGVKFILTNNHGHGYTKKQLLNINENTNVLPDLQLWQTYNMTRIDKDTEGIQTMWAMGIFNCKILAFDAYQKVENQLYQVILFSKFIALRFITNKSEKKELASICIDFPIKRSLCLHHEQKGQTVICSYVEGQKDKEEQKRTLHIVEFFLQNPTLLTKVFNQEATWQYQRKQYPFLKSMLPIIKHEYIRQNTFLMLVFGSLFFGIINQDNQVDCFKQSFVSQETKGDSIKKQELLIKSFAANQDSNKKTDGKRARFFVALTDDGKILLCDLAHDLKARLITTVDSQLYAHIAFQDNIISLWSENTNGNSNPAYEIVINWHYYEIKMLVERLQQTKEQLEEKKKSKQAVESVNSLENQSTQIVPEQVSEEKGDKLSNPVNNGKNKEDGNLHKKLCNIFPFFHYIKNY